MLNTQQAFCNYLGEVQAELNKVQSSGFAEEWEQNVRSVEELEQEIRAAELIVPVVGAFSAGKSTLINSFLESDLLPVNITPETALATELRYSHEEYIEAVKTNEETDRYDIGEISEIKEKASQYKYVKGFLDSPQLQGVLPLVLVDMPGFDSPLDLHHQAILTYLARGSHYAVLISVEEGTVTQSTLRQLAEFHEFDKGFSVFVSKANLRSASEVEAIARNIEEQLKDDFDFADSVVPVGKEGGAALGKMLKAIDPEALFDRLWRPRLEGDFYALDASLNTWISSLRRSESENQEAIDQLAKGLRELEQKKEQLVRDIRAKYSTSSVRSIVDQVGGDLNAQVDALVNTATSQEGTDAVQQQMGEIVRSSVLRHVKAKLIDLNAEIVEELSDSLEGTARTLSSYVGDETDVGKFINSSMFGPLTTRTLSGVMGGIIKGMRKVRGFTALLAITTTVVAPVVEVAIVFLPDIIAFLQQERAKGKLREDIIGRIIPEVKNKLASELPGYFDEQVSVLINEQAGAIDLHIKAKRDEIVAAERTKKDAQRDVEQTIAQLTGVRETIRSLANETIFTRSATT